MLNFDSISIKSKIGVEYRRYALKREDVLSFDGFYKQIEAKHQLSAIPFVIFYTDPDNFFLPINNDDNLAKAISSSKHIILNNIASTNYQSSNHTDNNNSNNNNNNNNNNNSNSIHNQYYQQQQQQQQHSHHHPNHPPSLIRRPYLRLFIEKKGTFLDYYNGTGKFKKNQTFKGFSNLILPSNDQSLRPSIGMPEDFRQVSSIIDVDIVPETCRRVRIVKHGSDRPLGFYIRDGTYKRMNAQGQMELVTGIFISRLVPGGLAESTGLLAVNDEVLEVNGIQVTHGKTLDQVTDMMVANSSNLIITIRPGIIYSSKMNNRLNKYKYPGAKRLMLEAQELKDNTEDYCAQPIDDNLFEWHFTVRGPADTAFDGGYYHGRLSFPTDYPMKPPSIILLTPNGRFETNKKICLSISGYHPETWQPSWSVRTALLALIAFMPTKANRAIGSLDFSDAERKKLAAKSKTWRCETCGLIKDLLRHPEDSGVANNNNNNNNDEVSTDSSSEDSSSQQSEASASRVNDAGLSTTSETHDHDTTTTTPTNRSIQSNSTNPPPAIQSISRSGSQAAAVIDGRRANSSSLVFRSIFVLLSLLILRRVVMVVQA